MAEPLPISPRRAHDDLKAAGAALADVGATVTTAADLIREQEYALDEKRAYIESLERRLVDLRSAKQIDIALDSDARHVKLVFTCGSLSRTVTFPKEVADAWPDFTQVVVSSVGEAIREVLAP